MAFQEFPKWLYHADGRSKIVPDAGVEATHREEGWVPAEERSSLVTPSGPASPPSAQDAEEAQKAEFWAAPVKAILDKLENASKETIAKVIAYEQANPSPRKTLLVALEKALAD